MKTVLVYAALVAASLAVAAQERHAVVVSSDRFETVPDVMANTFQYVSTEAGIAGKVVKGAPYSASAVTESVQTLADGNRITHTTNASLARDSQGRTRREQSFPALGPWASQGPAPKMTTINDPVAGVNYMLDDSSKAARKLQVKMLVDGVAGGRKLESVSVQTQMRVHAFPGGAPPSGDNVVYFRTQSAPSGTGAPAPKVEELGSKTFEGVVADGIRTTLEIPAGAAGNDRAIQIVDERWYSQELQTMVMTRHSDPRSGDTTFRLTNISRAEPSSTLFEVPSDYKVLDAASEGPMKIQIERKQ